MGARVVVVPVAHGCDPQAELQTSGIVWFLFDVRQRSAGVNAFITQQCDKRTGNRALVQAGSFLRPILPYLNLPKPIM